MSIRSAEFTPPALVPNGCPNCGGPCYIHTTDSTGLHQVKCGIGLDAACGYHGPFASDKDEAILLNNAICYSANIERLEKVNEALVSRLEDCLTSELTQQYGRHKGLHETDCSSVQDYLRPVPCDCAWGKLADALRMAKEPA